MIRGSCLCSGVRFQITGKVSGIGQCHCLDAACTVEPQTVTEKVVRLIRFGPVLSLAVALVACATTPRPGLQGYEPVPAKRVAHSIAQIRSDENPTRIMLKRDPGAFGSLLYAFVRVDGRNLVVMHEGEYLDFDLNPGSHTFEVGTIMQRDVGTFITGGLIGVAVERAWPDEPQTPEFEGVTIECEPGRQVWLRLYPSWFRGIQIERQDSGAQ